VWRRLGLEEERKILLNKSSGPEVIETILAFNEESKLTIILLLWCWWHARNKVNQGERSCVIEEICNSVYYHLTCMQKFKLSAPTPTRHQQERWFPPPDGFYKLNCDGSYFPNTRNGGWGCII
jgi:hypothetical protein